MSDPKTVLDVLKKRMDPQATAQLEEFQLMSLEDKLDLLFLGALEGATNIQWLLNKFNQ